MTTEGDPLDILAAAGLLTPAPAPRQSPVRSEPLMDAEAVDRALADLSRDADL